MVAVLAAALLALTFASPVRADPGPPVLADGFGLTQVAGAQTGTATNFVISVTTAQVSGEHPIKIILPSDYFTDTAKRYPVLYFLHGSPDFPQNQLYSALTGTDEMITVIPDGGRRGWYSNWLKQNTPAGAQNWETFHIDQVIPFIDANLRTIPTKQKRAVAGISMGGFGAVRYAERHPDLFSQVATLSGDVDFSVASMDLRLSVVASLTDAAGVLCASSSDPDLCHQQDLYKPAVDSDALYGTPYPFLNADWRWNEASPGTHAAQLAGMGIYIYTGNNDFLEFWVEGANKHFKDALNAAQVPYYYVGYGDGSSWGCDGGHNAGCWDKDLHDLIPRLEQAFA
ncbi:hypothetical protein GCM10010468_27010 [Actinocorallia longicatena]|uniref:S-formylglutathione hydrolase FrmB n=1 Tax=Actinocorallia longicatena TaxID=111803 RepID=A0ABP6Q7J5_9ACTN